MHPSSALPSLSIAIPVPLPHPRQRPPTPGPPPLSPVSTDDSSYVPNSSPDSPNLFYVQPRTYQTLQGLMGVIWSTEDWAMVQAFLTDYQSKEGISVPILEVGEGGGCQGCSLRLTGTRGLVCEGGVEWVLYAFRS